MPLKEFVPMFETKIAVVIREDLATWQKLNVTAFLASGIVAQFPEIIGDPYRDAAGNVYNPLSGQPIVILAADQDCLRAIHKRALERNVRASAYIEDMFSTGHDTANRDIFSRFSPQDALIVELALRADRKLVDKITKGAKMHP